MAEDCKKNVGHELISGEDAWQKVSGLDNPVHVELGGADIFRGSDGSLGFVTIVIPAAGDAILLYPFEHEIYFS